MARIAIEFCSRPLGTKFEPAGVSHASSTFSSRVLKAAALATAALLLSTPSFAQHGGGGGGGHGGGFGGGGGHSAGGGHFGGAHSASATRSGGGSAGHAGRVSGGAGKRGAPMYGVGSTDARSQSARPHETGIGAALRHFFGIHVATSHVDSPARAAPTTSNDAVLSRAATQASLPPAFAHLRLTDDAAFRNSQFASQRAALFPRTASVLPRPIWPRHPRHPVFFGGFGFFPEFGFGFGLPIFGFDCFWFDCYGFNFGSYSYAAPWSLNANTNPPPTMLLYLSDGSAFEVTDYWVEGDTLHYVTEDKSANEGPVSGIDVQRTTDANARNGFRFDLNRRQPGTALDRIEPGNPPDERRPEN